MRLKVCLTTVLVLAIVAPGAAQMVSETQFFPVVAHTAGAGDPPTSWRSDLTVHNVMDDPLTVGVMYFPSGGANPMEEILTLQGRETRTVEDVVATLFGITANSKGSLLLQCDESIYPSNPDGSMMLATTRTYNVGSEVGTFGTAVPTVQFSGAFLNGGQSVSLITGVRNDSDFRSNLGIVNFSAFAEVPITVHYRFLDEDGTEIASGSKNLGIMDMNQWSFKKLGVPAVIEGPLTVELWLDEDDIPGHPCDIEEDDLVIFVAYATKVDGNPTGSGDGEFIYATPLDSLDCD